MIIDIQIRAPLSRRQVTQTTLGVRTTTGPQAARLAAFFDPHAMPAPLWDDRLIDRLSTPLSRIRE